MMGLSATLQFRTLTPRTGGMEFDDAIPIISEHTTKPKTSRTGLQRERAQPALPSCPVLSERLAYLAHPLPTPARMGFHSQKAKRLWAGGGSPTASGGRQWLLGCCWCRPLDRRLGSDSGRQALSVGFGSGVPLCT